MKHTTDEEAKGITTSNLEKDLKNQMELGKFLQENESAFVSYDVAAILAEMIREKNISKAELARRAQMSDIYLFQILSGRRKPSRDRLICICIALGTTLEEASDLLRKSRLAGLYARERRDAIVMFAFEKGWNLRECNDALYEAGEKTLV